MNLNAPELNLTESELRNILQEGVSLNYIYNTFDIPKSDSFTLSANNLLPENLYTSDKDGNLTSLPESTLKKRIDDNVEKLFNVIKTNVQNSVDRALSVEGQLGIVRERETLEKVVQEVTQKMDVVVEKAQNFIITVNQNYKNSLLISNYKRVMSDVINKSLKSLSNKNIRDLSNDREVYNNFVAKLITDIMVKFKDIVRKDLKLSINPTVTVSSVVNTSLISANNNSYDVDCYVRVYYQKGQGADPETFDGMTVLKTKLISGRTCAVDNSTIIVGSKVLLPDGKEFLAKDTFTGSSVRPALYLFFTTREEAENYLIKIGVTTTNRIKVRVTPPNKPKNISDYNSPSKVTIRGVNKKLV